MINNWIPIIMKWYKVSIRLLCLFPSFVAGLIGALIYFKHSQNIVESSFCFLMVFLTTAYGFTLNNFIDRYKDLNAPRVRNKLNLVNNPYALRVANTNISIFFVLSIFISFFIDNQSILINSLALIILTLYSFINNKYGILANFLTALCPAMLIWIYPFSQEYLMTAILLFVFIFVYVFSREIIMDTNDRSADIEIGKTSFPILFGSKFSKFFAFTLLIITSSILSLIIILNSFDYSLLFPIIGTTLISAIGYVLYLRSSTEDNFKYFFNLTSFSYILIFVALL